MKRDIVEMHQIWVGRGDPKLHAKVDAPRGRGAGVPTPIGAFARGVIFRRHSYGRAPR